MHERERKPFQRYSSPQMTRVYVDPVRELLLQTTCNFSVNSSPACANPCLSPPPPAGGP